MKIGSTDIAQQHYRWFIVVLVAALMGIGPGMLSSISMYLKPLVSDFGWLRGQTSLAYLVGSIAMGAGGVAMGYLADRHSARRVILLGVTSLGIALILLAHLQALWQLYLYYILLGGMGSAAFDAPLLAYVGKWFDRHKGLAIGIATAGRSLGQGLVPFAAGHLIIAYGWQGSYLVMGTVSLVVLLPMAMLLRNPPLSPSPASVSAPDLPRKEAAPAAQAFGQWKFVIWIGAAAVFCCIAMATPMLHLVALAQDRGIAAERAGDFLLVIFTISFFGRIAYGKLADSIGALRCYIVASAGQTLTVFWFARMSSLEEFYVLAALYALGFSGVMTSMVICVREYAPAHRQGISQGVVLFLAWVGMGMGGWQAGIFFDLTGDYTISFANSAGAGLINLAILEGLYVYMRGGWAPQEVSKGPRLRTT